MRTTLSRFCTDFEGILEPLVGPTAGLLERLGDGSQSLPVFEPLPRLRDSGHKLKMLVEKIREEQAYVLIFGPLKSGKSTLMNAITGAYVSEVTALPAYPCLVYVSHKSEPEFEIRHFDGTTEHPLTATALRESVESAHAELAREMRSVEDAKNIGGLLETTDSESFEPGVHLPSAIRRVDVRIPAGDLEESGAVLVDTPGLYTRMKFGYDQMTKDFRNTAACAVFVVKTDNLFLEQVFAEFHELLELFGRIFLVVNLDGNKRDLQPDGSLVPSLESENPQRIIEAFESLSMSAPLKQAVEEGRLDIYPIDLLSAASARLRKAEDEPSAPTGFERFRRDLTKYLESTQYFQTFVHDTLRYAETILREIREIADGNDVREVEERVEGLRVSVARAKALDEAADRVVRFDWSECFEELAHRFDERLTELLEPVLDAHRQQLRGTVSSWFDSDDSLSHLANHHYVKGTERALDEIESVVRQAIDETLARSNSETMGLELPREVHAAFNEIGVGLEDPARSAKAALEVPRPETKKRLAIPFDEIPVKRGVWDVVLFRSQSGVRERLFGSADHPDRPLSAMAKQKNLAPEAKDLLLRAARGQFERTAGEMTDGLARSLIQSYSKSLLSSFAKIVRHRRDEYAKRRREETQRLEELEAISSGFADVLERIRESVGSLEVLRTRYEPGDSADTSAAASS